MDVGLIILYIFLGFVFLAINFYLATEFQTVAEAKGYKETKYQWICFFCGIAGMLLVIALPNKSEASADKQNASKKEDNIDELPDL